MILNVLKNILWVKRGSPPIYIVEFVNVQDWRSELSSRASVFTGVMWRPTNSCRLAWPIVMKRLFNFCLTHVQLAHDTYNVHSDCIGCPTRNLLLYASLIAFAADAKANSSLRKEQKLQKGSLPVVPKETKRATANELKPLELESTRNV